MDLIVPLAGLIDFAEEKKRVEKELAKIQKDCDALDKKLANKNFIDRAPADVVAKDKQWKSRSGRKESASPCTSGNRRTGSLLSDPVH